jgi:hypothetical protein
MPPQDMPLGYTCSLFIKSSFGNLHDQIVIDVSNCIFWTNGLFASNNLPFFGGLLFLQAKEPPKVPIDFFLVHGWIQASSIMESNHIHLIQKQPPKGFFFKMCNVIT